MASPPSHVQALLPDPSCLKLNSVEHQDDGRVLAAAGEGAISAGQLGPHRQSSMAVSGLNDAEYATRFQVENLFAKAWDLISWTANEEFKFIRQVHRYPVSTSGKHNEKKRQRRRR